MYSIPIRQLIRAFTKLPTVGQRTAERFVFYLLKSGKKEVAELMVALKHLSDSIKSCETCWDFSDRNPCGICQDGKRDPSIICVVAEPQDLQSIERTGAFRGRYHILRGVIKSTDDMSLQQLKISELLERIQHESIKEIVLALNPDLPGDTTMMFLERQLKTSTPDLTVSRLARGLPMGSDLQYADEITLQSALRNRTVSK